jgi:hypothetical protein
MTLIEDRAAIGVKNDQGWCFVRTKTCAQCGKTKPVELFNRHYNMRDKLLSKCKRCNRKFSRAFVIRYAKRKILQCVEIANKMADTDADVSHKRACWKIERELFKMVGAGK